jgi:phosphoribosylglycinamide formyltransferase-1
LPSFASGSGTNAEAIIKYFKDHPLIKVELVLSNNPMRSCWNGQKNLPYLRKVFNREEFASTKLLSGCGIPVLRILFLRIPLVNTRFLLKSYPNEIINIHPALLPKFGGKGNVWNENSRVDSKFK